MYRTIISFLFHQIVLNGCLIWNLVSPWIVFWFFLNALVWYRTKNCKQSSCWIEICPLNLSWNWFLLAEKCKEDDDFPDPNQTNDLTSAYLGPQIWNDMLLSDDLQLEPVNLDDLLDPNAAEDEVLIYLSLIFLSSCLLFHYTVLISHLNGFFLCL